jgi:hypothetical protein
MYAVENGTKNEIHTFPLFLLIPHTFSVTSDRVEIPHFPGNLTIYSCNFLDDPTFDDVLQTLLLISNSQILKLSLSKVDDFTSHGVPHTFPNF